MFDTPAGRAIYGRRMPTVEPVFANLQNKGDSFERQGEHVRWLFGKPDRVAFEATFKDDHLVSLWCPEGW